MSSFLSESDPLINDALNGESDRQQHQIELIASENIVSQGVLEALGHRITNKTLEGYPGHRFHGGAEFADIIEQAAIDRAKSLFGCEYVNVQPHSGTQANQAVFFATLKPGDRVLSLDLAAGGHLSHGAAPNMSGRWFDVHHYGVDRTTGLIDYDQLHQQALDLKPAILIAGGSAYPRELEFARLGQIAAEAGAIFLVDMAHIAGLVAGGAHPSPIPFADVVTCTTTKTLRGPRGGLIISKDGSWAKKMQSAIFPGVQGSLHTNVIAAKAVCLGEALEPAFKAYAHQVTSNARALAERLMQRGVKLVGDGTDTHLLLLDLSDRGLKGQQVQDALTTINITSNKNPVPFDARKPSDWAGLRLGVAAVTTRGFGETEMRELGDLIADIVENCTEGVTAGGSVTRQQSVAALCERFPAI
ncbi:MAG: serine hydroxymethyltransferase [Gammaproteobacteria bacterium]